MAIEPAVMAGSAFSSSVGQSTTAPTDCRTVDQRIVASWSSPSRLRPSALPSTLDASASNSFASS